MAASSAFARSTHYDGEVKFDTTPIPGVVVVHPATVVDHRGSFLRSYSEAAFAAAGLNARLTVSARATNPAARTLRGIHHQADPHAETKLVSCASGRIFDVAVDLRRHSPTFGRWFGMELDAEHADALLVPAGCAHGYITLEPRTTVLYHLTDTFHPDAARGIRWDDPRFGISWPCQPAVISERDRTWPLFPDKATG